MTRARLVKDAGIGKMQSQLIKCSLNLNHGDCHHKAGAF